MFFFITTGIYSQNNITNTLGTGGVFYVKEASNTFFMLSQVNRLFVQNNSSINRPQLTLAETQNDFARLNFLNNQSSDYWSIAGYLNSTAVNSRLNFYSSQLGADVMSITGSGNVGIGASTPVTKLYISDATNPAAFTLGVSTTARGYTALLGSLSSVSNGYVSLQAVKSAGSLYGDLVPNKDGGSVGIGTSTPNPNCKLDVNGPINASNVTRDGSPLQIDIFHGMTQSSYGYGITNRVFVKGSSVIGFLNETSVASCL